MKRKASLYLPIILLLALTSPVQAATPKAGDKCTKVGATSTAGGKKFTCIKSGKKLVWNKGVAIKPPTPVAIPTPTPSPSPEPTPTPTPSATPTPTPTPTTPPVPIVFTFDNISENISSISTFVYNKVSAFKDPNFQSKLKVNVHVGPNTMPLNSDPSSAYATAANLLRNYKLPEEVNVIYYSYLDKNWAKSKTQSLDGTSRWDYQFEYECVSESNCRGASAGMTQNWHAIGRLTSGFTISNPYGYRMFASGETEIHEFTHSAYMYQMKPNFNRWYVATPSWFSEGHASALGKLGAAISLDDYKAAQLLAYRSGRPDQTLKSFGAADILRFYESFNDGKEDPNMKQYVYTLGYSTIEALMAIGGVDSPMNLFVETTKGATFAQAFKTIYGIEWKVAAPILAEVVSKQYQPFAW